MLIEDAEILNWLVDEVGECTQFTVEYRIDLPGFAYNYAPGGHVHLMSAFFGGGGVTQIVRSDTAG